MSKSKVGILLPTYNQGQYLHEAITSLRQQTYQDLTVLIVDDHSSDKVTQEIVKKFSYEKAQDVIIEPKNLGLNNLTIKYLPKLDTEYLLVFCADDILEPTFLEKTVKYLDENRGIAAVASWLQYFGDADGVREYDAEKCILPDMLAVNHFCGSSLVRKSVMREFGWSSPDSRCLHQDHHRWVSILERGHKLGVINEPLFRYRILNNSMSHGASLEREIKFKEFFLEKHAKSFEKYHKYVILEIWKNQLKWHDDYKQFDRGHEWLDAEYKKQLVNLKNLRTEYGKLNEAMQYYEISDKWSIYPILKRMKSLFSEIK